MSNEQLTKKEQKQFLEAMARARKDHERAMQRQEARLWQPISVPITLEEALSRLSTAALSDIRKRLNLKGASALKKDELCALLSRQLQERYEEAFECLNESMADVVRKAAERGGKVQAEVYPFAIDFFQGNGVLFPGTVDGLRTFVMPEEAKAHWARLNQGEYRRVVRCNTEWIQLTQGMLYFYGVLRWEDLAELLKRYETEPVDLARLKRVIEAYGTYDVGLSANEEFIQHQDVEDPEQVLSEHAKRAEIPYYAFTKKQLVDASDEEYIDQTPAFRATVAYFGDQYEVSREQVEEEVDQLVFGIQLGDPMSEAFELLQRSFECPDRESLNEWVEMYAHLNNNTRQWVLKGHMPSEITRTRDESAAPQPGKRSVGRNDPCPCGSGKKYKKCCGG
ncbi:SEC-C domain-containing protein [Paenibacillus sp. TRM 82003]|nr:SEC-C domain-containing protein [Paenibacillus sp. TRM 82003]